MTLDEYQQAALRTVNPALDERDRLLDATSGLAEEAAELLGLVRKRVFQNRNVDPACAKYSGLTPNLSRASRRERSSRS